MVGVMNACSGAGIFLASILTYVNILPTIVIKQLAFACCVQGVLFSASCNIRIIINILIGDKSVF